MKNKTELKIEELKKELTAEEIEKAAENLAERLNLLHIEKGATIFEKYKAQQEGTAEAVRGLFGLPYISQSINNTAAALWNTNTEATVSGLECFQFQGVAVGEGGEVVGLFQEMNNGEEVGGVRFIVLNCLIDFIAEETNKEHEAEKVAKLQRLNGFRQIIAEMLPKCCTILEKHRGKRWGEKTQEEIRKQLNAEEVGGVRVSFGVSGCFCSLEFIQGFYYAGVISFWWSWDKENNTPAEEIKPKAEQLEKIKQIEIKTHRQKIKKLEQEIETKAAGLLKLLEEYRTEAKGNGYKYAENLSVYSIDFSKLKAADLDR